jgi:hypothetical protein
MKLKFFFLLASVGLTFFLSCKKNVIDSTLSPAESNTIEIKTENDYLVFKNYDNLFETLENTNSKSKEGFRKQVIPNGFISLSDLLFKANLEINSKENESDKLAIIDKYKELLFLGHDGQLKPKNGQELISHLLNPQGFIKVGNILIKFDNDKVYSTTNSYNELINFSSASNTDLSDNILIGENLKKTKSLLLDRNPVNTSQSAANAYYLISQTFTTDKRRFFINLIETITRWPNYDPSTGTYLGFYYEYRLAFKFGHQKKGIFGWNTTNSSTYVNALIYNINQGCGSGISGCVPASSGNLAPFNLPYGENQYYYIYNIPAYYVPFANVGSTTWYEPEPPIPSLYIQATGDGQPWYSATFSRP